MSGRIRFGVYELDRDAMELRKHGVLIRLQEHPFRVLAMLAERPGEVITREQLQEQIWGNTFVDFDQSLNKAVNRVREALNDNAGTPQYIETVPRRGYRFIAPLAALPRGEVEGPIVPASPIPAPAPAQSTPHRTTSRMFVIAALATACVLAAIGVATVSWLRKPRKPTPQEARLINSSGWWPALSRDGKLLAYTSNPGSGTPHIWVQQTAGGNAIQVTPGSTMEAMPDFSPDGTHIVFYSARNGGGIYIAPTLPGEPRLLVSTPYAKGPRFSPSGSSILYWLDYKAFTVSVDGGQAVALPLNQDFRLSSAPIWSPSGDEILFYGLRQRERDKPRAWRIVSLATGRGREVLLPGVEQNYRPANAARAWIRTDDGREWIIYSTDSAERWKLWRIGISPGGATDHDPVLFASGNGRLGPSFSASADGKLAYNLWDSSASIYQISIDDRGQKLGPILQLPLPEDGSYSSPSVSRDGRWLTYSASKPGKADTILLRDLGTSTEHLLDDKDWGTGDAENSISPDGSRVIISRDCKDGRFPRYPCGFVVGAASGGPERVCELCAPRGFSSDGSVVLLQKYDPTYPNKDRIVALNLRTRTERDFLSHPDEPLFHAYFSWDDHWVIFKKLQSLDLIQSPAQILIAPVRHGVAGGEAEWIAVTDGQYSDDKPQFSADGNTVYFTSTRDGYLCIWAQRLDPVTKHPLGQPFAFEHFHNAEGRAASIDQSDSDLTVARDKMLINLPQIRPEIWLTQIQ
jgi:DNA-binding winged helix-turn-helix (wHTH) protein/Tol biopolymer transport system component